MTLCSRERMALCGGPWRACRHPGGLMLTSHIPPINMDKHGPIGYPLDKHDPYTTHKRIKMIMWLIFLWIIFGWFMGDEASISCVQCPKTRVKLGFWVLGTYALTHDMFLHAFYMRNECIWISFEYDLKKWNMGLLPLGNSLKKRCSKASKGLLLRTYQPPIASSKSHLQLITFIITIIYQ